MTLVKFCGISGTFGAEYVNLTRPNLMGMVFAPGSKRRIELSEAAKISHDLDGGIAAVGVFRDQSMEEIIKIADVPNIIDMIQLHGSESEEFVDDIRNATGLPVIRAFTVSTKEEASRAAESCADYIMFDTGPGTGRTFDWSVLEDVGRPFFLAGGLTPENVGNAIERVHPYAVDTSSGIETNGHKDPDKMRRFMEAVRSADRRIEDDQ